MGKNEAAYLTNLREKRMEAGLQQIDMAAMIPATQSHFSRVETQTVPASLAFILRCVEIVGALTVRKGDQEFVVATKEEWYEQGRPKEQVTHGDVTPVEGALIAQKEMRDFLEHSNNLAKYTLAILRGDASAESYLSVLVKEAEEARFSAERVVQVIKRVNPEAYHRGMEIARAEISELYGDTASSVA